MEIPKFLIERYQFWKENTFKDYKDIYQQASKTPQKPFAMIITFVILEFLKIRYLVEVSEIILYIEILLI